MSKGGGGGGTSTTVQKADPWVGLQPGLQRLYSGALQQYDSGGPKQYPGSTLAPTNWNLEHALQQGYQTATDNMGQIGTAVNGMASAASTGYMGGNRGAGVLDWFGQGNLNGKNSANQYLDAEANGTYLTDKTNPYLKGLYANATDPMVEQFQKSIAPGLASQFAAAGRTGSGAHESAFTGATDSLGRSLATAANSIYGGAYENERQRQQQAIQTLSNNFNTERAMQLQGAQGMASAESTAEAQRQSSQGLRQSALAAIPSMVNSNYTNLDKMMGVGQYQQNQQQQDINAAIARFNTEQQQPILNLQTLNQLLQGGSVYAGSSSTGKTGQDRNPFASALGGAAMTTGLGSTIGGEVGSLMSGGWGALLGALGGGLFL